MEDFAALTLGERAVLAALNRHEVRFMVVGLSAAVLQGANTGTRDIVIWFENLSDARIFEAVREAGGIGVPGSFGMRPPQIGGDVVGDRLDVVIHMHGLGKFAEELGNTLAIEVDGIPLRVLRLERIIDSKRAAGRSKDLAVIPALEEALAAARSSERSFSVLAIGKQRIECSPPEPFRSPSRSPLMGEVSSCAERRSPTSRNWALVLS